MKKYLIATMAMLAVSAAPALAQDDGLMEAQTKRGPYLTNRLIDKIFILFAGGINVYQGESDSYGNHVAPALDVSVGKWVTPCVGLRLQYSGLKANGWDNARSPYAVSSKGPDSKGMYQEKFNVMNLHGDVMWNISNAIGGYKETRTWNFVPYVGFGWARSAANNLYNNEFAFTYGLLNNIRLGNLVDLNLEVKQMVVNQGFDQVVRGAKSEGMFTVTAGLTFKLNRRGFNRPTVAVPADYTPYNNKIAALEDELAKSKADAKRLADELAAEKNKVKEAPAAPAIEGPIMGTFFNIGSYTITPQEIMNLGYVANYIKAYPNKKFTIVGYADSATGSAKRNQYLSQQRADAVCKVLVDRFGVDASQLEVVAKGGTDKFPEIPLNRVAIVESNK